MERFKKAAIIKGSIALALVSGVIIGLSLPLGLIPPLGNFLLPGNGVWNVTGELDGYEEVFDAGLDGEVRVYRDEWGVPHIYGHGEADLFFALGYCQAQDRMIQMDLVRRSARGTMAELVGPSMVDFDKFNLLKMENYWAEKSLIEMQESEDPAVEEIYALLIRFVDGINKYIGENGNSRPFEYQFLGAEIEPWEMVDTLVYAKYISEYFTWGYSDFSRYNNMATLGAANYSELFGLPFPYQMPVCPNYGEYDDISLPPSQFNSLSPSSQSSAPSITEALELSDSPSESLILHDSEIPEDLEFLADFLSGLERFPQELERINPSYIKGSNNWVVAGNKTASGKPLLCNDMHLGWSLPGMWYEAHLIDLDSDLNLYALFLPGVPLPVAGHTKYLGWGETIAAFDMMDWYYYDGINDTHYEYKGNAVPYEVIQQEIRVKGEEPQMYTIKSTVHGPVFTDLIDVPDIFSENVIACKWVSQNVSWDYLALYEYMRAEDVDDFYDATRYFECLPLNIVFGDTSGNIGVIANAKIPIRNDTDLPSWHIGAGRMPYNGSKGEGEWIGYVPFEERPFCINPEQGYLQSANQYIAGPDYPDVEKINVGGATGYRARRINEVLAAGTELDVEDMQDLQLDIYSIRAGNMTPFLVDVLESTLDKNLLQLDALDALSGWNYEMEGDSAAAAIFSVWNEALMYSTFDDDREVLGQFRYPSYARLEQLTKEYPASHWFDNLTTPAVETRDDIILVALDRTLAALETYFSTGDIQQWKWGEIHQLTFDHILGIPALGQGPYPGHGSPYTVNPSYTSNLQDWAVVQQSSRAGASERIIVDFGDLNNSLSVIPSGARAISSSPHYSDQLELFLRGEYHVQYYAAATPAILVSWADIESTLIFKKGGN